MGHAEAITTTTAEEDAEIEEVIVAATRIPTAINKVGSFVTIFSATDLREHQWHFVDDALRASAGISSTRNGARGALTNVRFRGQGTEATYVVIDGIEASDPSTTQTRFNFANLGTNGIERIELLRGSNSVLYGGDAIGGVININTQAGGDTGGSLYTEGGSYGTQLAGTDLKGSAIDNKLQYGISAFRFASDGFSAADSKLAGNSEKDGYDITSINGRSDILVSENVTIKSAMHYASGTADYDSFGGAFGDDSDLGEDFQQLNAKITAEYTSDNRFLSGLLSYTTANNERLDFDNGVDTQRYHGKRNKWLLQSNVQLSRDNNLAFGIERERESLNSKDLLNSIPLHKAIHTNSYYLLQQLSFSERWSLALGARFDDHETFGNFDTYRIASAYRLGDSVLKASIANGFRAPSLFELYGVCCGATIGNDALQPEQSRSFDMGIQQQWLNQRANLEVSLFYIETDNEITFDFGGFTYTNNGPNTQSRGLEISHGFEVSNKLQWHINYTYNRVEDEDGKLLSQRPKHSLNADIAVYLSTQLNSHLLIAHNRNTIDTDFSTFPSRQVKLEEPWLVDLLFNYEIIPCLNATLRVENIFNEYYQPVFGYGAAGRSAYAGLRYRF